MEGARARSPADRDSPFGISFRLPSPADSANPYATRDKKRIRKFKSSLGLARAAKPSRVRRARRAITAEGRLVGHFSPRSGRYDLTVYTTTITISSLFVSPPQCPWNGNASAREGRRSAEPPSSRSPSPPPLLFIPAFEHSWTIVRVHLRIALLSRLLLVDL